MLEMLSTKTILVVWREALEAILIVGIICAFLLKSQNHKGLRYMIFGVVGGIFLSAAFGYSIVMVDDLFTDERQVLFKIFIMSISAVLMTHMVFWMKKHGRTLKSELERDISKHVSKAHLIGVTTVTLIAVLREGVETVIFIYGLGAAGQLTPWSLTISSLVGFFLAAATFTVIAKGLLFFSQKYLFKFTEAILLFAASGLLAATASELVAEDFVPALVSNVWDTSHLVSPDSFFGAILSTWFGYTPSPSLFEIIVYFGFWIIVLPLYFRESIVGLRTQIATPSSAI